MANSDNSQALSIEHFPTLAAGLRDRPFVRLADAIRAIADGLHAQRIPNPAFQDAKEVINRRIGDAWRDAISARWTHAGEYQRLPTAVFEAYCEMNVDGVHSMKATAKRVAKIASLASHPMIDAMQAFVREMEPLAVAVEALRPHVFKRQPKTDEEREAEKRFVPPPSSTGATKMVGDLLEGITARHHAELITALEDHYLGSLVAFLQRQSTCDKSTPAPSFSYPLSRCLTSDHKYPHSRYTANPNAQETLKALARKDADEMRDMFVYKNLRKLSSIVEAKGNLDRAEVIDSTVNLSGLRGELRFAFSDGARFLVQNSAVLSHSVHNNPFMRYPLTFHEVVMPSGEKMKLPSEERMNTVFVGKDDLDSSPIVEEAAAEDDSPSP
jgi:hypothetical protein